MYIMKGKGKYTVYGDGGKVVIITSNRQVVQSVLKSIKRDTNND